MRKALFPSALLLVTTMCAHADDGDLEITPITENVFLHTSYRQLPGIGWFPSNGLIVVDGERAVLVDTAWTEEATREIVAWLKARDLVLDYAVATHSHDDRTAGFAFLESLGVKTFASAQTNEMLLSRGETAATDQLPDSGNPLGDTLIEVHWPGAGHTRDNHVVWIPKDKVLFGGCLVKSTASKTLGNIADADVSRWSASIDAVVAEFPDARVVVPGHQDPGGMELLRHTQALVQAHGAK